MAQLTAEVARRAPPVKRTLFWTLGLGAFGLAFSITTTAGYLPPLLSRFTESGTLIGLVLGAEGVFAIALSPVIGPWSDTFHTPLGRRRPFMLAALGPMAFCLLLMPFMPTLWTTTLIVLAFFFAYYVYEPPYRGLYPDLLPPSTYGRGPPATAACSKDYARTSAGVGAFFERRRRFAASCSRTPRGKERSPPPGR